MLYFANQLDAMRLLKNLCLLIISFSLQAQTDDLMIVEYVDWDPGSGWAIKIHNPTANSINLSNYYVQVYNGNNTTATGSQQLSGQLASGASIIVSNANNHQAGAGFQACNDDVRTNLGGVNNDDCIALTFGNGPNFVDMVGLYGVAVKNRVDGVANALKWQKLVRNNGNCTRYNATDGSSANSWPSSASVSLSGWTVSSPACLSTGNNFNPFGNTQVQNESICQGDSFLFNNQYLQTAGTYYDTSFGGSACGQINRLNLTISPAPSEQKMYELCSEDSILVDGDWFKSDTIIRFQRPNPGACDSLIEVEVRFSGPQADFDWRYNASDSSRLQFYDESMGNPYNRVWDFGDGDSSSSANPQHQFNPGTYTVSLILEDANGCISRLSYQIYIPDQSLKLPILPNVFTPNGDGLNDFYHLSIEKGPVDFQVTIMDRYGLMVFESSDPQFKWDGQYQGQALGTGTYFIQLQWEGQVHKNFLSLQN